MQPAPGGSAVTADSNLLLINGLWGLFLACGVLLTSLKVLKARGWLLGRGWLRGFLADYGVPLMIVAWSGLSFAVHPAPGVPRRVETPNTWEVGAANWVPGLLSRTHPAQPACGELNACLHNFTKLSPVFNAVPSCWG